MPPRSSTGSSSSSNTERAFSQQNQQNGASTSTTPAAEAATAEDSDLSSLEGSDDDTEEEEVAVASGPGQRRGRTTTAPVAAPRSLSSALSPVNSTASTSLTEPLPSNQSSPLSRSPDDEEEEELDEGAEGSGGTVQDDEEEGDEEDEEEEPSAKNESTAKLSYRGSSSKKQQAPSDNLMDTKMDGVENISPEKLAADAEEEEATGESDEIVGAISTSNATSDKQQRNGTHVNSSDKKTLVSGMMEVEQSEPHGEESQDEEEDEEAEDNEGEEGEKAALFSGLNGRSASADGSGSEGEENVNGPEGGELEDEQEEEAGSDDDHDVHEGVTIESTDHAAQLTARRMAAMAALTKIEIAFAQFRDQIFNERMEECAIEEEKLLNGTHPHLKTYQSLLADRKHLDQTTASRRQEQMQTEIERVRKADTECIWQLWKTGREHLQKEMMGEVMRKRRRVDREKREVEGVGRSVKPKIELKAAVHYNALPSTSKRPYHLQPAASLLTAQPPIFDFQKPPLANGQAHEPDYEREVWGPQPYAALSRLDDRLRNMDLELLNANSQQQQMQQRSMGFRPFEPPHPSTSSMQTGGGYANSSKIGNVGMGGFVGNPRSTQSAQFSNNDIIGHHHQQQPQHHHHHHHHHHQPQQHLSHQHRPQHQQSSITQSHQQHQQSSSIFHNSRPRPPAPQQQQQQTHLVNPFAPFDVNPSSHHTNSNQQQQLAPPQPSSAPTTIGATVGINLGKRLEDLGKPTSNANASLGGPPPPPQSGTALGPYGFPPFGAASTGTSGKYGLGIGGGLK